MKKYSYQYLKVEIKDYVATIYLNNPKKANAMNKVLWADIGDVFRKMDQDGDVKVCVLAGKGKHFTSGVDINYLGSIMEDAHKRPEKERENFLYETIKDMQASLSAVQHCRKPVIAAIHGVCVGGGVDLIAACDVRYTTSLSVFSIMETKLGIVADMGTLQRLRFMMNDGRLKELAFTSKLFRGFQAESWGLVNKSFFTTSLMLKEVYQLAYSICELPAYAVQGTKQTINASRDVSIEEGLDGVAKLNAHLFLTAEAEKTFKQLNNSLKKKHG
jgi:enoyl-CoA hydratase